MYACDHLYNKLLCLSDIITTEQCPCNDLWIGEQLDIVALIGLLHVVSDDKLFALIYDNTVNEGRIWNYTMVAAAARWVLGLCASLHSQTAAQPPMLTETNTGSSNPMFPEACNIQPVQGEGPCLLTGQPDTEACLIMPRWATERTPEAQKLWQPLKLFFGEDLIKEVKRLVQSSDDGNVLTLGRDAASMWRKGLFSLRTLRRRAPQNMRLELEWLHAAPDRRLAHQALRTGHVFHLAESADGRAPLPDRRVLQLHADLSHALEASAIPALLRVIFRPYRARATYAGCRAIPYPRDTPFFAWYLIQRAVDEGVILEADSGMWASRLSRRLGTMMP
jgi:hypothetical protein